MQAKLWKAVLFAPGRILPAAAGLATVALGNRYLPLDGLGVLSLYLTTTALGALVLTGWLNEATLRFLPGELRAGSHGPFLSENAAAVRRVTLAATAAVALGLLALLALRPGHLGEALPFLAYFLLSTWFNHSQILLVARADAAWYSGAEVVRSGASVALLWAGGARGGLDVPLALWLLAAGQLAGVLASWARSGGWRLLTRLPYVHLHLRAAWGYAGPLAGWIVGAQLLAVADRYLVQAILGSDAVAVYSANYQFLPAAAAVAAVPILYAGLPAFLATGPDERERAAAILSSYTGLFLLATLPLAFFLAGLSREAALLVFGPAIAAGAPVVPWVIFGNFLWSLALFGQKRLELEKRTRTLFALVLAPLALSVLLDVVLLPRIGLLGAGIATCASYLGYFLGVHACASEVAWRIPLRAAALAFAAGVALHFLCQAVADAVAPADTWLHLAAQAGTFVVADGAFLAVVLLSPARHRLGGAA